MTVLGEHDHYERSRGAASAVDERMERRAFVMFRLGGIWRLGQIPEMEG
jgi:hypothetical protein